MARTVEQSELEVERLTNRLQRIINQRLNRILKQVKKAEGLERVRLISEISTVVSTDPQFLGTLGALEVIYGRELRDALERTGRAVGAAVAANELDIELTERAILTEVNKVQSAVHNYMLQAQRVLISQETIQAELNLDDLTEQRDERTFANIKTELNTAVISYNRAQNLGKGIQAGFTLFRYLGPDDGINRAFCDHLVGDTPTSDFGPMPFRKNRIYALSEIEQMRNGQGLDVFTSGGGWNCRHVWRAISNDRARGMGYDGPAR